MVLAESDCQESGGQIRDLSQFCLHYSKFLVKNLHGVHSITSISKEDYSKIFDIFPILGLLCDCLKHELKVLAAASLETVNKSLIAISIFCIVSLDLMRVCKSY